MTALARRLERLKIGAVYASPLTRALDTATILAKPHGLKPFIEDGLREISHGQWKACRAATSKRIPDEYEAWNADPFTFAPRGAESGLSVMARVRARHSRDCHASSRAEQVVVVSHKATLRLLLSSLLGIDPRGYRDRLDQSPACLNVLDFKDVLQARLMLFNDTLTLRRHAQADPRELVEVVGQGRKVVYGTSTTPSVRGWPDAVGSGRSGRGLRGC